MSDRAEDQEAGCVVRPGRLEEDDVEERMIEPVRRLGSLHGRRAERRAEEDHDRGEGRGER
jgi:hypothetical protein